MKEGLLKMVTLKVSWIAHGTAAVERAWILVVRIADKQYGRRSRDEKMEDLWLVVDVGVFGCVCGLVRDV